MSTTGQHKIFHLGRMLLGFLFSVFFFSLLGFALLFFNAERIINRNLSEFVYQKSDSTYLFEFKSLRFDVLKRKLVINNITLIPDQGALTDSTSRHYQLNTPSISIENINYVSLIKNRRFVAGKFSIEAPNFRLSSGDEVKLTQFESTKMKIGDTLQIPVFSEIFFDTLLVVNANLNVDSIFLEKYELPKVNIEVLDFKLGGRKTSTYPFPFDVTDISLKVENIVTELPDDIHLLTVKKINLSLLHSSINAEQITLSPRNKNANSLENQYTIEVPSLSILSKDVEKFYVLDTLRIDSMVMQSPSININFGTKVKKGTPPNEINLYKLIENKFSWIKVKQFSIQNGEVKFFANQQTKESQHFENMNVTFFDFMVDSNAYRNEDLILSAKTLEASLSKFTLYHVDKVHVFTIENIVASTKDQLLTSGAVTFQPLKDIKGELTTRMTINSEGFVFKGFNFYEFYHHQQIPMKELIINSPIAHVEFDPKSISKMSKRDKSIILEKTRDYLTGIYVETARIRNGSMEYKYENQEEKSGFFKTKFNFELKKLSIDSLTFYQTDKIFFAQDFNIQFSDIFLQLADNKHQLETKKINLSSKDQSAEIFDIHIFPKPILDSTQISSNSEIFDIYFPHVNLNGASLHKAFFEKKLSISNFTISNPIINIEKIGAWEMAETPVRPYQTTVYTLIDEFLFNVQIENLTMENGVLNLTQKHENKPKFEFSNSFSIKLSNFELNEKSASQRNKLFFSDNIDLVLKKQELKLADGVHKLSAEEIGILSSRKEIYIKKAYLYPDVLSNSFKNLPVSVFATIPEIKISEANIFELMNEGNFVVKTIAVIKPEIKLLFQKIDEKEKAVNAHKPLLLLEGMKSLTTNRIVIQEGSLELANYSESKSKTFITTKLGVEIENFKGSYQKDDIKTNYTNFYLDLKNFHYNLPDQTHALNVEGINYQLRTKTLQLNNFTVRPINGTSASDKKQYFNLILPNIQLSNIDLEDFLRHKRLIASSLYLSDPIIQINDQQIEKGKPFSPYHIDIYSKLKSMIETIEIDDVSLINGSLDFEGIKPLHVKKFDLRTQDFNIDSSTRNSNKLFYSDRFNFKIYDINGKTKAGYFNFNATLFELNEKGDFKMNGISLKPVYNHKEFVRLKKIQTDYFDFEDAEVAGQNLDLKKFIENGQFVVDNVNAKFKKVSISRDKSVPLKPGTHKKLPQHGLRDLKKQIGISRAIITCDEFEYTEFEPNATIPTLITVTDIQSEIVNITNIKEKLVLNKILKGKIDGKLMGVGDSHVEMNFDIPSFSNKFTLKAELGEMPLNIFNSITEPGLKLSIKEGYSKKMDVFIEANEDSAVGTMKFEYNDLKVSVLSNRNGEMREDKFVSFVANTFVKSDNPKPGKFLMPVKLRYQRKKQHAVIGYCWQSIYNGIKTTVGINEKEEKP